MPGLLEIQQLLMDTNAALSQLERAVVDDPSSHSLSLMRDSLKKRQQKLELDFLEATKDLGVDVCRYRFFSDVDTQLISPIAEALGHFQSLVSVVYDAIINGPKKRASVSADVARNTAFGFGYSFAGSAGFVLTIRNERLLLIESKLDDSIHAIFDMAQIQSPEEIQPFARRYGAAALRQLYKWSTVHSRFKVGADIDWRRGLIIRDSLLVEPTRFSSLTDVIEHTGEESSEELTLFGDLVGADVLGRTFHIRTEGGQDIRGTFENAISPSQTVKLPKLYRARMTRSSRVRYSTDTEEHSYFLHELVEL